MLTGLKKTKKLACTAYSRQRANLAQDEAQLNEPLRYINRTVLMHSYRNANVPANARVHVPVESEAELGNYALQKKRIEETCGCMGMKREDSSTITQK